MAGGKETPRQKMIGMMYLVLTALLAMNISKDVLNAFIQINKGLGNTIKFILKCASKPTHGLKVIVSGVYGNFCGKQGLSWR